MRPLSLAGSLQRRRCSGMQSSRLWGRPSARAGCDRFVVIVWATVFQFALYRILIEQVAAQHMNLTAEPSLSPIWLPVGILGTSLISLSMPRGVVTGSHAAVWVLFIVLVLPAWVQIYAVGAERHAVQYVLIVVLPILAIASLTQREVFASSDAFDPKRLRVFAAVCLSICVLMIPPLLHNFPTSFSLYDVYERRLAFRTESGGKLLGYLLSNTTYAVIPVASALAVSHRRWSWMMLAVTMAILVFLIDGSKLTLALPVLVIFLDGAFAATRRSPTAVVGGLGLCAVLAWVVAHPDLNELVVRRAFFVPVDLTLQAIAYVDEFGPTQGLDIPMVAQLFDNYPKSPPFSMVLGSHLNPSGLTNANVSAFVTGYAQLGWCGVGAVLFSVAILLRALDRVCRGRPQTLGVVCGLTSGIVLSESATTTALLSSGLVGMILCCWLLRPSHPPVQTTCLASNP